MFIFLQETTRKSQSLPSKDSFHVEMMIISFHPERVRSGEIVSLEYLLSRKHTKGDRKTTERNSACVSMEVEKVNSK